MTAANSFGVVDNTKVKACLDRCWRVGFKPNLEGNYGLPLSFCDSSQATARDSHGSTLTLEQARSDSSEDEATDMRQVCHAAGLHLRHSACMEELSEKPKTN